MQSMIKRLEHFELSCFEKHVCQFDLNPIIDVLLLDIIDNIGLLIMIVNDQICVFLKILILVETGRGRFHT